MASKGDSLSGTILGDFYDITREFIQWLSSNFAKCGKTKAWCDLFFETDLAKTTREEREAWLGYLATEVYTNLLPKKKDLTQRNAEGIFSVSLPIIKEVGLQQKYEMAMDEAMRQDMWVYLKAMFNVSKKFHNAGSTNAEKVK